MNHKNLLNLAFLLFVLVFNSCGGDDSSSSSTSEEEDACAEMEITDWKGFLGIKKNTPESKFKEIIPGTPHGDYSADGSMFQYVFDDMEDVSTYINVNAESGEVEYYNILLNVFSKSELSKAQKRMNNEYDVDPCHDQFFGLSQKEIEKIMGKDNEVSYVDNSDDYWLQYWDKASNMEVHFYMSDGSDELGCIMIRVFY